MKPFTLTKKIKATFISLLLLLTLANPLNASEFTPIGYTSVSAKEAMYIINTLQNVVTLDVGSPAAFATGHLTGAVPASIEDIESTMADFNLQSTLVVYARENELGETACRLLKNLGYKKLYLISGGLEAWKKEGYTVITSQDKITGRSLPPVSVKTAGDIAKAAPGYCASGGGSTNWEYLTSVTYSELPGGVLSITAIIFITNPMGCTYGEPCPSYDSSPEYVNGWIDWNGNQVFDADERVLNAALTGYTGINYSGSMSTSTVVPIPAGAVGNTWMRVNLGWSTDPDDPCLASWSYGNVMDVPVEISVKPPEIEDIKITGIPFVNVPLTNDPSQLGEEKVKFEAQIKEQSAYEITEVRWSGDITPGEGNPYEYVPAAGSHGNKNVICTISYKNKTSGETGTATKSKPFKLFFRKSGDDDGNNEPNWFKYWKSDGAVPNMGPAKYDAACTGYGYMTSGGELNLGPKAAKQHYTSPIVVETHFGTESFGGPNVKGIDCTAEIVAHENYHKWVNEQWKAGGTFVGSADSDKGIQAADCNDKLPDTYETNTSHTKNDDTDTYDLEHKKSPTYRRYGDNEYMAMRTGNGARGTVAKDWAFPGKQTNPAYEMIPIVTPPTPKAYIPADAAFEGSFTESTPDNNSDGLYDVLRITADLNVISGGDFDILGILFDLTNDEVVFYNSSLMLESGSQPVNLDFDGLTIREHGVNGPYDLTALLTNDYGDTLDYDVDVYTTAAYDYTSFKQKDTYFLDSYSDAGNDTDFDSRFDSLGISLDVYVENAGNYLVEGGLYTKDEKVIELKAYELNLVKGSNTVTMNFNGMLMSQQRLDGPYYLRYLSISNDVSGDFILDAYTTSAYSYNDFESTNAQFTSDFSEYGEDTDSDNRYNQLAVEVEVTALAAGEYSFTGYLFDSDNAEIMSVDFTQALSEGINTLRFDFNGITIYSHGVDGPYLLKNFSIVDGDGKLMNIVDMAKATQAYLFTDFQKPPDPLITLSGNYSAQTMDENEDCVIEALSVDIGVSLLNPGFVIVKAKLEDKYGEEIGWAENIAELEAGTPQIIQLTYDAATIYEHGVDGPYTLKNVYIYHTGDPTQPDYVATATTTDDYLFEYFDTVPGYQSTLDASICQGESYTFGESILTEAGTYDENHTSINGCDSTTTLNLMVNASPVVDLGEDATITVQDTLILDAGEGFNSYYWSTEEATQTILIDFNRGTGKHEISVLVTDANECSNSDTISITIEQVNAEISVSGTEGLVKLYPNPAGEKIQLDIQNITGRVDILIYAAGGQLMFTGNYTPEGRRILEELDITSFPSGIYYVSVQYDDTMAIEKFVIR